MLPISMSLLNNFQLKKVLFCQVSSVNVWRLTPLTGAKPLEHEYLREEHVIDCFQMHLSINQDSLILTLELVINDIYMNRLYDLCEASFHTMTPPLRSSHVSIQDL